MMNISDGADLKTADGNNIDLSSRAKRGIGTKDGKRETA